MEEIVTKKDGPERDGIALLAMRTAHDLNNLLVVIHSSAEALLEAVCGNAAAEACADDILAAGRRATVLTRQLLVSSEAVCREVVDVNRIISEAAGVLRRLAGPRIHLELALSPSAADARISATHMERILMNLAANSRDAMPGGGELRIETHVVRAAGRPAASDSPAEPGDAGGYVLLTVTDTGCGMDEDTRARIFDPFFTTKPGQGTGLGLPTVHELVTACRGRIAVESEIGAGTTFRISLPHRSPPPAAPQASGDLPIAPAGGGM